MTGMTRDQVRDALRAMDLNLKGRDVDCLEAFAQYMSDKHYGHEETLDAFLHFEAGWNARRKALHA